MGLGSSVLEDTNHGNVRFVKGCPCFKQFGSEKVCLNEDDVLPVSSITVDPSFFAQMKSVAELDEFKSNRQNMCYLLICLDKDDDYAYCVSQGKKIKINDRCVRASDIDDALQFVTVTEQSGDGVVCSSCLYKYLVTLGDVFEDLLTEQERSEVISEYVEKLATKMALDVISDGEANISDDSIDVKKRLRSHIRDLMRQKSDWASLVSKSKEQEKEQEIIRLIEHYKTLSRLEAVFIFQVLTLIEATDEFVAVGLLKFMIELAERAVNLNDEIRETTHNLDSGSIPKDIEEVLEYHSERRKRTEKRFQNLLKVLSQM